MTSLKFARFQAPVSIEKPNDTTQYLMQLQDRIQELQDTILRLNAEIEVLKKK